jgi:superfamily II DNA helicase RecQ
MDYAIYSGMTVGAGILTYIYKKFPDIVYKTKRFAIIRKIKEFIEKDDMERLEQHINKLDDLLLKYKIERRKKNKMITYTNEEIINKKENILKSKKNLNYEKLSNMIIKSGKTFKIDITPTQSYNNSCNNSDTGFDKEKFLKQFKNELLFDIKNLIYQEIQLVKNKNE